MTDKSRIEQLVREKLDDSMFLVDLSVSSSNQITVLVDSFGGLTIDQCVAISRHIEQALDRDQEDFDLQVSSPGLTEGFKVKQQYLKNKGRQVEILTKSGDKLKGLLLDATEDEIVLETSSKEKAEGQKKKQLVVHQHHLKYESIQTAKVVILFK